MHSGFTSAQSESLISSVYYLELQQPNGKTNCLGRTLDLILADEFSYLNVLRSTYVIGPIDAYRPPLDVALSTDSAPTLRLQWN